MCDYIVLLFDSCCFGSAGESATAAHPLVWLRFENDSVFAEGGDCESFALSVRSWPGDGRAVRLADAHYHGHWMRWLL